MIAQLLEQLQGYANLIQRKARGTAACTVGHDETQAADAIADPNSHDKPCALAFKKLRRRGLSIFEPDIIAALK